MVAVFAGDVMILAVMLGGVFLGDCHDMSWVVSDCLLEDINAFGGIQKDMSSRPTRQPPCGAAVMLWISILDLETCKITSDLRKEERKC